MKRATVHTNGVHNIHTLENLAEDNLNESQEGHICERGQTTHMLAIQPARNDRRDELSDTQVSSVLVRVTREYLTN